MKKFTRPLTMLLLIAIAIPLFMQRLPASTTVSASSGYKNIWVSQADIKALDITKPEWNVILKDPGEDGSDSPTVVDDKDNNPDDYADESIGSAIELSDQEMRDHIIMLAKAIAYVRFRDMPAPTAAQIEAGAINYPAVAASYLTDLVGDATTTGAFQKFIAVNYSGRALALGRNLAAIVIAADIIDLKTLNPSLDNQFRQKIVALTTTATQDGPKSLIECHKLRPNNWGHHCGASRLAVAIYTNNTTEIQDIINVFKKGVGDTSTHNAFIYGELTWQCDPQNPVFINRKGCTKNGYDIGGSQPEEMRRECSTFAMPACHGDLSLYNWEGMQGLVAQLHMLERQGYAARDWGEQAIKRAAQWNLRSDVNYPIEADDQWQVSILNYYYDMKLTPFVPARPGKIGGFTDLFLKGTNTTTPPICPGDFNKDTQRNIADFGLFAQNYNKTLSDCTQDMIGGNCRLDIGDFGEFAKVYNKPCGT